MSGVTAKLKKFHCATPPAPVFHRGNFKKSYIALVAFRTQLITENCPHKFERFRLLSNPQKVDLFRRVQRRTRLHRREFSRGQAERIRQRHTDPRSRERVEHVRVALLSLRKCGLCDPFHDAVNSHEIDLSRAVGNRVRWREARGQVAGAKCLKGVPGAVSPKIAACICALNHPARDARHGVDRFAGPLR